MTIDAITELGVAGLSARKVATRADVPLGSITYHFADMDELLREAFTRFADSVARRFEERMQTAVTEAEAKAAVARIIHEDVFDTPASLVLTHELYTLAARVPEYRTITRDWMRRSRAALECHFDPMTARQLDALIEGLTIHRALDTEPHDVELTVGAIESICHGAAART